MKIRKTRTLLRKLVNMVLVYHTTPYWDKMLLFLKEFNLHNGQNVPNWLLKEKYGWSDSTIYRLGRDCAIVGWLRREYKKKPHWKSEEDRLAKKKPSGYSTIRWMIPLFLETRQANQRLQRIVKKAKDFDWIRITYPTKKAMDLYEDLRPQYICGKIKELECGVSESSPIWDSPRDVELKLKAIREEFLEGYN